MFRKEMKKLPNNGNLMHKKYDKTPVPYTGERLTKAKLSESVIALKEKYRSK